MLLELVGINTLLTGLIVEEQALMLLECTDLFCMRINSDLLEALIR